MKLPFPSYKTTFTCDCTLGEATKKIQDCVAQNHKEMKIKKAEYDGVQRFVIETSTGSLFYRNSALPKIKISLKPIGDKTEVTMLFELKRDIKIMSSFFIVLALFMILTILVISIKDKLPLSFDLFSLPLTSIGLMTIMNVVCLKITSKSKMKIFLEEFGYNHKDKENSPKLELVKLFTSTESKGIKSFKQ